MKKIFDTPVLDIAAIEVEDIITTSAKPEIEGGVDNDLGIH